VTVAPGFILLLLLPVAMLVGGYLQVAEATSRKAATGVLLMVLGTGLVVWALNS
jgi:hypothetical protein